MEKVTYFDIEYANSKNIKIIGDIPIYVPLDSADVWAEPGEFLLDENLKPKCVAGCPPDSFSADGQLWGNPIYDWKKMKENGFVWWKKRLGAAKHMYDVIRIDHFRGFDEYFSIPAGAEDARTGHWEKGPGMDLFRKVSEAFPGREIIAEDLGYVTDSVRQLVKDSGYPGMKVLEFAFDSRDSGCAEDYLPHNYEKNSVVYTGTHDNETLAGWFMGLDKANKDHIRAYLSDEATPLKKIYKKLINLGLMCAAKDCIVPIQDWLGLDNSARMNQPGTVNVNWSWRLLPGQLTDELCEELGLQKADVIAVGSHDTASAVVSVPASEEDFIYISCGTWSLFGIETPEPIINDEVAALNFTNEGGVGGTIRVLKNICGMWLLERCRAEWGEIGYGELIAQAEKAEPFRSIINPDAPCFANPESMTAAIDGYCVATNQPVPSCIGEYVRTIFESLALRYRQVVGMLSEFTGVKVEQLYVIGGGAKNDMLNQFSSNAIGVEVTTGASEATAWGNIAVQAESTKQCGGFAEIMQMCSPLLESKHYEPQDKELWQQGYEKFLSVYKEI